MRRIFTGVIGQDLSLPAVVTSLLEGEDNGKAVVSFCEAIMVQKENAEREREKTDPVRRRRRPGVVVVNALMGPVVSGITMELLYSIPCLLYDVV